MAIEAAAKIKLHGRRAAESIVAIGEELARVKAALPHGSWLPWLEAEFGWGESSAKRFMQVAAWAAEAPNLGDFTGQIDVSALYLLARPSTPEPVREAKAEVARLKNAQAIGAPAAGDGTCTVADLWKLVESGQRFGSIYADPIERAEAKSAC